MRMRLAWLIALVLLGFTLSGCFGGDEDGTDGGDGTDGSDGDGDDHDDDDHDGGDGGDDGDGDDGNTSGNQPPSLGFTVDVASGAAPLNVTFFLNGTDPDGDVINWTLDADDDGTPDANGTGDDLPANVTFLYEVIGNYTAVYTVSDGTDESVFSANITVTEGGTGAVPEPIPWEEGPGFRPDPLVVAGQRKCPDADNTFKKAQKDITGLDNWMIKNSGGQNLRIEFWSESGFISATKATSKGKVPEGATVVWTCSETANDAFNPAGVKLSVKFVHPDHEEWEA